MEHNEDMTRLEQLVDKLINRHNQLQTEKDEIVTRVREKEQEVLELQERIKDLQEDRSAMHNQVTGLIDRISECEKIIEQESNESGTQVQGMTNDSSLFNTSPEQSL